MVGRKKQEYDQPICSVATKCYRKSLLIIKTRQLLASSPESQYSPAHPLHLGAFLPRCGYVYVPGFGRRPAISSSPFVFVVFDCCRPSQCVFKLSLSPALSHLVQRPLPLPHLMLCMRSVSHNLSIGQSIHGLILPRSYPSVLA